MMWYVAVDPDVVASLRAKFEAVLPHLTSGSSGW